MSLKAKLEAVIYAAEEPVTLAQLAALFAAEALEWKAQQAAEAAAQSAPEEPAETLPLLAEGLEYLGLEQSPAADAADAGHAAEIPSSKDSSAEFEAGPPVESAEAGAEAAAVAPPDAGQAAAAEGEAAVPAEAVPEAEGELKRQARQRDREVRTILKVLIDELIEGCAADGRGVEIREIAGGYRVATKPECHDAVRLFVRSLKPPLKLSLPALETLAVIAYKQPVTAPEVNEIRGVESGATLGSLLSRKLIATAGRKQVVGRPILYKTTREFLLRFGLKDVAELPSMEEFEKMAAIELDDREPADESAAIEPSGIEIEGVESIDGASSDELGDQLAESDPPQPDADLAPAEAPQAETEAASR